MVAVGLDEDAASEQIKSLQLEDKIQVACMNALQSTTISGDSHAIHEMVRILRSRGIFAKRLETDGKAYHSNHMRQLGQSYEALLSSTLPEGFVSTTTPTSTRMFSTVTGQSLKIGMATLAAYWRENLISPVRFRNALKTMLSKKEYTVIEVGPHSAMKLPINQIFDESWPEKHAASYFPTLLRGKNSVDTLMYLMGSLWLQGYEFPIGKVNSTYADPPEAHCKIATCKNIPDLPTYPWHYKEPLWHEPRVSVQYRNRDFPPHDLLGSRLAGPSEETGIWINILSVRDVPWLEDHKLGETVVFPAAAYLAIAIEALCQLQQLKTDQNRVVTLQKVQLHSLLNLPSGEEAVEISTEMVKTHTGSLDRNTWWQFSTSSWSHGSSALHATGLIAIEKGAPSIYRRVAVCENDLENQTIQIWYEKLAQVGLNFGKAFQSIYGIQGNRMSEVQQAISKVAMLKSGNLGGAQQSDCVVHPITIDSLLQTAIIASAAGSFQNLRAKVPVLIDWMQVAIDTCVCDQADRKVLAVSENIGTGSAKIQAELSDRQDNVLIQMHDVKLAAYNEGAKQSAITQERYPILKVVWKPDISSWPQGTCSALTEYTDAFKTSSSVILVNNNISRLAGAVDLIAHQNPDLRWLEIGCGEPEITETFMKVLNMDIGLRRCQSFMQVSISPEGDLVGRKLHTLSDFHQALGESYRFTEQDTFDVVLVSDVSSSWFSSLRWNIKTEISPSQSSFNPV